jgi:TatD DNase family protein
MAIAHVNTTPFSLFDAHCHLQDARYADRLNDVMVRAQESGVTAMSCCGTSENDWQAVEEIAGSNGSAVPSFGLHPWYVMQRSTDWLDILENKLVKMPLSCCGEIGLDHTCDPATFPEQESVFLDQLRLASRLGRAVTIHCRRAYGRLLELLRLEGGVFQGGLIHSYSGPPDLVGRIQELGLSISFSGSITFPNSKRARESARFVSSDRLCMETDSPDIKPVQCHTAYNEPANIIYVAQALSDVTEMPFLDVAARTRDNAVRLFNRKSP